MNFAILKELCKNKEKGFDRRKNVRHTRIGGRYGFKYRNEKDFNR